LSRPIRVLIVDDDVPTRVGVTTILASEQGIEVVGEAADGQEACDLARTLAPDVVLMDVQLPGLDGIEATRRITSAGDDAPRVLVLTTFDVDEYVVGSVEAGASGFLLKRARAERIVEAVRLVADGEVLPIPVRTAGLIAAATPRTTVPSARFVPPLTDREADVLILVARGLSNQEVADGLHLSVETVRTHLKHIYTKSGARNRLQAVIAAFESGVVHLTPPGEAQVGDL
jgi:DNA-binding NarL/FixJ family response regulator